MQLGTTLRSRENARNLPQGNRRFQGQPAIGTGLTSENRILSEIYPDILDAQPAEDIRFSNLIILVMEYINSSNKTDRHIAREKLLLENFNYKIFYENYLRPVSKNYIDKHPTIRVRSYELDEYKYEYDIIYIIEKYIKTIPIKNLTEFKHYYRIYFKNMKKKVKEGRSISAFGNAVDLINPLSILKYGIARLLYHGREEAFNNIIDKLYNILYVKTNYHTLDAWLDIRRLPMAQTRSDITYQQPVQQPTRGGKKSRRKRRKIKRTRKKKTRTNKKKR